MKKLFMAIMLFPLAQVYGMEIIKDIPPVPEPLTASALKVHFFMTCYGLSCNDNKMTWTFEKNQMSKSC